MTRLRWASDAHSLSRAGCLETLLKYGHDGELEPMLATEWNQVQPTTWEFTLREGVTFQDGTAMDADAVAGALSHLLDVETPARAFNADAIAGVSASDESGPGHDAEARSPGAAAGDQPEHPGILAPKAYEDKQIDIMGTCTGPFTVTDKAPQQSTTPHYREPETDQMIQDAAGIESIDERNATYAELAAKLQSEAASVFLLHEHAVWGTQADVANFEPHPLDYYILTADLVHGN